MCSAGLPQSQPLETPLRASTIVLDGKQGGDQNAETDLSSPDVGPGVRRCVPSREGHLAAEEEDAEERKESEEGACEVRVCA